MATRAVAAVPSFVFILLGRLTIAGGSSLWVRSDYLGVSDDVGMGSVTYGRNRDGSLFVFGVACAVTGHFFLVAGWGKVEWQRPEHLRLCDLGFCRPPSTKLRSNASDTGDTVLTKR